MNAVRTLVLALLATALSASGPPAGNAPAPGRPLGDPSAPAWAPYWVTGWPPGTRPRPKKLDKTVTAIRIADDRSDLGVSVRLWADTEVQKGSKYQLVYQLRIHTKKGELGPILGSADKPTGTTVLVDSGTADDTWSGLEGQADINRKDLSGMTNLPQVAGQVILRVEPQLYDVTAGKFLTQGKTPALIVVAIIGKNRKVESIVSLARWIEDTVKSNDKPLALLADLDDYTPFGNELGESIHRVLGNKEIPPDVKSQYIRAVPKEVVGQDPSPQLWATLEKLAEGNDVELKAAAKAKLQEAR